MAALDLSHLSPTFLLPTHLSPTTLSTLTSQLHSHNCPLTPTPTTASLFLADINTARRCDFELRGRGIKTAPLSQEPTSRSGPPIRVVKLKWFTESLEAGRLLPIEDYTVYTATITSVELTPSPESDKVSADEERRKGILKRARRDAEESVECAGRARVGREEQARRATEGIIALSKKKIKRDRQSTPEYEEGVRAVRGLRDMPEWVQRKVKLSCCRSTPESSPNDLFIAQLRTIRLSRILTSDDVGTRAYSTAIAVLKAYPHPLTSPSEVTLLPGCSTKISSLFKEWLHSHTDPEKRSIAAVTQLEQNENLTGLKLLYSIWGIGPKTAREMWFEKRWRTLDDVVEYGWKELTRVQQIGVKYYDDFQQKIPRVEAERIEEIIARHAERLKPGTSHILAGSYRRGSTTMSDVDVLLSHTDTTQSHTGFIEELISSLEKEGWITYTLHLGTSPPSSSSTTTTDTTHRGIDTLEKAMIVWQEQEYTDITHRTPRLIGRKNKNLHRRVDIVFSPPECAATALLGWSGATTFERDLRLWCESRGWRFACEGVFEIKSGERAGGVDSALRKGESMVDAEKRLFEDLGLQWRAPEERCTG